MSETKPDIYVGRALILDEEGKLAIAQRSATSRRNKLMFEFPGGQFDAALDKNIQDTAVREPDEEMGLAIRLISREAIYSTSRSFTANDGSRKTIQTDFFGAVALTTQLDPDPTEIAAAFWRWPQEIQSITDLTQESRTALGAFGAALLLPSLWRH